MSSKRQQPHHVAILLLAHAGVTQPKWWEAWLTSMPDASKWISLYILTQEKKNVPISNENIKWQWIPLSFPTYWCNVTQVEALQVGLRYILENDQKVEVVYFVSGSDVPFGLPSRIYLAPPLTRLNLLTHPKQWTDTQLKQLSWKDKDGVIDMKSLLDFFVDNSMFHMADISLSRKDAKIIAYFPAEQREALSRILYEASHKFKEQGQNYEHLLAQIEKYLNWIELQDVRLGEMDPSWRKYFSYARDQLHREVQLLKDSRQRQLEKKLPGEYRTGVCDDEVLPQLMLLIHGRSPDIRTGITDRLQPSPFPRDLWSPITFDSWEESYRLPRSFGQFNRGEEVNLHKFLQASCRNAAVAPYDPAFFIRKVGPMLNDQLTDWKQMQNRILCREPITQPMTEHLETVVGKRKREREAEGKSRSKPKKSESSELRLIRPSDVKSEAGLLQLQNFIQSMEH